MGTLLSPQTAVADGSITPEKLAEVDAGTVLGNGEGATGPVTALGAADLQGLIGFPVGATLGLLKKTADTVFASATPANVPVGASGAPAFAFSLASGHTYYFRFIALVRSDTLTVGPGLSVTIGGTPTAFATAGQFVGRAADAAGSAWQGAITASDDAVLPDAVAATGTDYVFTLEGIAIPDTSTTLTLRARTETGTTNVTVRRGTVGMLWDLGA